MIQSRRRAPVFIPPSFAIKSPKSSEICRVPRNFIIAHEDGLDTKFSLVKLSRTFLRAKQVGEKRGKVLI